MDIIFSQDVHDAQKFLDCAEKLEYDEFSAKMFVFSNGHSDVDVFELMGNDRLSQLIYGWEVCHLPTRDSESLKDPALRHIVRVLAHHSLQMWFSQEWRSCSEGLKHLLLYSLTKAVPAFYQIGDLANINWSYVLQFQTKPWSLSYLQQLFLNIKVNKHHAIEHTVTAASGEDIAFLMQEGLSLALLRLIQLFNAGNFEAVKQLALRMLAAWLKAHENAPFVSFEGDKNSITLIGHLYLLTVFVRDENRGYVIDNLMYNIRFYAQTMQEASILHDINFTPARLIAQVCVRLRLGKNGFFEQIGFRKFKLSLVTSFAVMLEVYSSYVLGNLLMELQALNENDFLEHLPQFKELMHRYVEERESSERFLLEELKKMDNQRNSHFQPHVVDLNLNYQQQICKGNRPSNIGNYKNCDDDEKVPPEVDEEQDRQIDPVFQNVPNNEEVLSFVYKLLAERNFSGWKFAKIALLLKIIGQQLNAIEIWKYHPGLTVDFMLNLEQKMSANYADLAKVFSDHGFMEAEFWLTAFYLHPTSSNYNEVRRCSRIKKKRQEEDWLPATTPHNVKYELLSSTIDVDEIVTITNHNAPVADYDPIYKSLQALRLPRSMIKDLLTVIFQPRNKRYSWALDWHTLHERCHALLKSQDLKRKFVSLNMAEAGDDLKYLQIDYAKYRDRPQLDYGTIEEGYENAANLPEVEEEAEPTPEVDDEVEKVKEQKKRRPAKRKFWDEVFSEDEEEAASSDSEPYYTGNGRRTRIRAAAMVANAMLSDMDRSVRGGRRSSSPETSEHQFDTHPVLEEQPAIAVEPPKQLFSQETSAIGEKRTIGDLMEARTKFSNETGGFKAFSDIWSFEKEELQNVVCESNNLMECSSVLSKFKNWKTLKMATATKAPMQPCPQSVGKIVRSGSETESVNSETSTMATHDFNEDEVSEGSPGVSKELTHSPLVVVLQPTGETVTHMIHEALGNTTVSKKAPDCQFSTKEPVRTGQQTQKPLGTRRSKECPSGMALKASHIHAVLNTRDLKQVPPNRLFKEEGLATRQVAEKPRETGQTKNSLEDGNLERDPPNTRKQNDKLINIERLGSAQPPIEMATPTETGTETDTAEETLLWDGGDVNQRNKRLRLDTVNDEPNSRSPASDTMEMERKRLINECLTRSVQVSLTRLTPQDIEKLRGVRVRVKRTNLENFYHDQTRRSKRRLAASLNSQSRSHTEDSNASSNSYDDRKYGRRRFKKFVHITSDSPAPSESSTPSPRMMVKPVFKHITSDSSTDLEEVPRSAPAIRRRGHVRGRSGPKCKTQPTLRLTPSFQPDVIELSSDSLSSNSPIPAANHPMNHFTHAMEMDPLYEEAIIPF
ncbi:uncharacterized protein LOC6534344 isoform X1 [Drosophila yakuba]|uniref:Uncharacterized protein n=1 Tax=Drosophila yakuba TaxID=7245 RepID=B4PJW7_DROYA|nr:uncharacterized protein LOC6534344 isoform X1 [Drosophila yakuba]EDW94736.2 uncharacterized protein Dyak_GE19907 [Drosophila yakuba]